LAYLRRSPFEILDVVADGVYRRALEIDGRPHLVEVRSEGEPDQPGLRVSLLNGVAEPGDLRSAAAVITRCFRIDEDAEPLQQLAPDDRAFTSLARRLRGLRPLVMVSPLEALVWSILGQQINVAFAFRLKRALVERFGDVVEFQGQAYYLFPGARRLAALEPEDLRPLQISSQKASYIVGLARLIDGRQLDLDALRTAPADQARDRLMSLRGVGRWTAEYVLMRGLGARDELPAADVGLQVAAARLYQLERRPGEPELRALAEPWAGWRSYFSFYLWFSLAEQRQASAARRA
jgi:DNA-3-methyladenine glycosylase II